MKIELVENPNCPQDVLEVLARDNNYLIRALVAGNPRTPINVLLVLKKDKNAYVRYWAGYTLR